MTAKLLKKLHLIYIHLTKAVKSLKINDIKHKTVHQQKLLGYVLR